MATFDAVDDRLHRWIARHRRVFALTGAGCSTASGIPDYRDDQGEWKRRPPVMIQAFRTQDGGLPALLGARLCRMAAFHDRRVPTTRIEPSPPGNAPAPCAAGHAERRSPAPAGRQPRGPRPPRPSRRRRLPRLRRTHSRGDASGDHGVRQNRSWQPAAAPRPRTAMPTSTPRSSMSFAAAALRTVRRPAQAGRRLLRRERPGRALRARARRRLRTPTRCSSPAPR